METNDGVVDGETGSVYSWVESCLNEVGKTEEDEDDEQWSLFQDASSEEKREVMFPVVAAVKEEVVVREANEKRRLALVCFGLIGLVGGMIFGFIGDNMKDDNFFLTPT